MDQYAKVVQSNHMVINNHGDAVLIQIQCRPKDHKSEEKYKAIAVEGAIWPKPLTGWRSII